MVLETGKRYVNPLNLSRTTMIISFFLSLGSGPAKSIAIEEKGVLGIGSGMISPAGTVVGCLLS
jgi:hypothetical protein